jgi:hypothetical protein
LELSRLASLQNYAFTTEITKRTPSTFSSLEITGEVHSPRDWELSEDSVANGVLRSFTAYDVDGVGTLDTNGAISPLAFQTPEGIQHLRGEPYFAEQLLHDDQDRGLRLTSQRGCEVAGIQGQDDNLGNPVTSSPLPVQQGNVCLAEGSGALVQYFLRLPLNSSATAASNVEISSFTVTSVNDIPAISAP